LAHAPALVLEAALGARDLELVFGPAARDRLGRVEAREMLADDLVGPVALDLLGAGVPAHHPAARVDHEDGVVVDAFDEEAETFFGWRGARALRTFRHDSLGPSGKPGTLQNYETLGKNAAARQRGARLVPARTRLACVSEVRFAVGAPVHPLQDAALGIGLRD